jgi:hypothetical protein
MSITGTDENAEFLRGKISRELESIQDVKHLLQISVITRKLGTFEREKKRWYFQAGEEGGKRMKQKLMTYSQWEQVHKRQIKKKVQRMLSNVLQWCGFLMLMVGLPFGMIIHWLIVGYWFA